ncbi:MAG: hypothetical protein B5M56_04300 [Desulfococcus sp. 4484_241]|nr:MAG: hypothetical protein B5M56_04300 [Desulfococcus sp. 4484_241]
MISQNFSIQVTRGKTLPAVASRITLPKTNLWILGKLFDVFQIYCMIYIDSTFWQAVLYIFNVLSLPR